MPPPIEEEADIHDLDEASCSEQSDRDEIGLTRAELLIDASESVHSRLSPERVDSDIPLVVSDIQPTKEMTTPALASQQSGGRESGLKRKTPPRRSNHGVTAKRRKGSSRALPCVYCARRLANDPKWKCHDAVVSQDGKLGYTGTRCDECVYSHVSCCLLPPRAVGPVKALVRAAEEVNKQDGGHNIAVLAVYEAAIGPALRAMAGIGLQSSAKVNEPKKRSRPPKSKKKGKDVGQPSEANVPEKRKLPQASAHRSEMGEISTRSRPDRGRDVSQGRNSESQPPSGHLQTDCGQETGELERAAFQQMERQALRRRKVEALESLAHTAALFLAEFMDFKKGRKGPPANTTPPPGMERDQAGQSAGAAYAAAAASLFRPLSEEFDRSGYDSAGSVMEQPSSSPDGSDDGNVQAETPSEQKAAMDLDDGESVGLPAELLASLGNGEQADASEPGVKVEEH